MVGDDRVEYGRWLIEYWHRGVGHRESSGSLDRNVARRLLKQRLAECATGKLVGPLHERVTVNELLSDLAVEYEVQGRASTATLAHRTKALLAHLDGVRAVDVSTDLLNRLVLTWRAAKKQPATINRYLATLKRSFIVGAQARPPKVAQVPIFPRQPEHNVRRGWIDRPTMVAILAYLKATDVVLHDLITWLYWTAMRIGSARQLEWTSIDRETWSFVLPAEHEKSRKARALPLLPVLQDVLKRRWDAHIEYAQRTGVLVPWVFWRIHRGHPCQVIDARKAWASACEAAGCRGRVIHDLRRTALRNMRLAGIERRDAMLISGHRTESVFERYNVDRDIGLRDAMEKLGAYVESLPTERTVAVLPRKPGTRK
jgi:integrase